FFIALLVAIRHVRVGQIIRKPIRQIADQALSREARDLPDHPEIAKCAGRVTDEKDQRLTWEARSHRQDDHPNQGEDEERCHSYQKIGQWPDWLAEGGIREASPDA